MMFHIISISKVITQKTSEGGTRIEDIVKILEHFNYIETIC